MPPSARTIVRHYYRRSNSLLVEDETNIPMRLTAHSRQRTLSVGPAPKTGIPKNGTLHGPNYESFPPLTWLLDENVTCGRHTPGRFVAPTYTCADIRVSGRRMAYGYYAGWAVGQEDQRCQETLGVHEFAQLCLMLLKSINVENLGFKAAYVPKSTCAYHNETRKLLKKASPTKFIWTDFRPGWGWTETIQCMTDLTNV